MKLYFSAASPYARKARVTAIEAGLAAKIEMVEINPWTDPAGYRDLNPIGKVPTLVTDDGPVLFESAIVCQYLAAQAPAAKLLPDGAARWQALHLDAIATGMLDASVNARVETLFHEGDKLSQKFVDRQAWSVNTALDLLEREAAALGGAITLGHIGVGCALAYRDFRFAGDDWRGGRPKLTAWFASFAERPSMQQTRPPA
ncbi:MAG: glutathione S-transferase family protein [Alphaproteobacteria bacterium]